MDFEKEDKIISDFLKSLGPWGSYIVIGGGYAPIAWFKTFKKNLLDWQQEAVPSDWLNLEMQDQFGNLRKIDFVNLIERMLS